MYPIVNLAVASGTTFALISYVEGLSISATLHLLVQHLI